MANETEKQENGTGQGGLIDPVVMCACYPSHCEHDDTCWCDPAVELLDNGDKLIIHNKGH
jgi:hypothetical protein